MTDRPIIFSAPMVRALLDGRKTMTRRIIKPQPVQPEFWGDIWVDAARERVARFDDGERSIIKYDVGDRLWVRESFSYDHLDIDRDGTLPPWYWADGNPYDGDWTKPKPSIHMPRWASRLTLIVEGVKVERLQDISENDARAEGSLVKVPSNAELWCRYSAIIAAKRGEPRPKIATAVGAFAVLWDSINGHGAWAQNPWVCAITFHVIKANIDAVTEPTA